MIGVVVPAHNEAQAIGACLSSLAVAAGCAALGGEAVEVFVVLDRCTDATADIAAACGVDLLAVDAGNVGVARATGTQALLDRGARWIACTDGDTAVPHDWLSGQLQLGADVFCGMVDVADWEGFDSDVVFDYARAHPQVWGHPHVHGANLGFTADAYRASGGFLPLVAHEDVALVAAMAHCGFHVARAPAPRVITSARRVGRAPAGFAGYLRTLERSAHARRIATEAAMEAPACGALLYAR